MTGIMDVCDVGCSPMIVYLVIPGSDTGHHCGWIGVLNRLPCGYSGALLPGTAEGGEGGREEDRVVSVVQKASILHGQWTMQPLIHQFMCA